MIHYLRYCCAMFFALISFLLVTPLSVQAQTREAYVAQSAGKTTLTFYYDDQRATRTGTTWGIEETKKRGRCSLPCMGRNKPGGRYDQLACGVRCLVPRLPSYHHCPVVLRLSCTQADRRAGISQHFRSERHVCDVPSLLGLDFS